jgi:hypothetical protein
MATPGYLVMFQWLARYIKRVDIFGVAVELRDPQPNQLPDGLPPAIPTVPAAVANENLDQKLRGLEGVQRLLRNPNWSPTAEAALAYFVNGIPSPDDGWLRTGTWKQICSACFDQIIVLLDQHHQRATYGALAGIVGGIAQSVMKDRPKVPQHSWIVSGDPPNLPTGYTSNQISPQLAERPHVLRTSEELRQWLSFPQ